MFVNERANQIIEYLKIHTKATIGELAAALFASESTIRRDLTEMQKSGLVARYHGGAILMEGVGEVSIFARAEQDAAAKNECANIALSHIRDIMFDSASVIFIDNSSTCLALAKKLCFMNKTVVTNGLQIALQLSQKPDIHLILPGGEVHTSTSAITGSLAIRSLEMFGFDLLLCSCAAIDENGSYELTLESAQLKQFAMQKAKRKILIATDAKFSVDAAFRVNPLSEFDAIVTNADDSKLATLRASGIKVYN